MWFHGANTDPVKNSPCDKKPCLNNCECQSSSTHEGGYRCTSSNGHLGRRCEISKADITCGPNNIEVRIPRKLVEEYEAGVPGAKVYLSPESSNKHNCLATYDTSSSKYVVRVPPPFEKCGTRKTTSNAGGNYYSNQVWMNRASPNIDMPVPVISFKCVYNSSHSVVSTSLQPALRSNVSVVTNFGSFDVSLGAFKLPPGMPESERGPLTDGGVYIVGERIYLTANLRSAGKSTQGGQLAVKLLNCFASSSTTSQAKKLYLVTNGCPESQFYVTMIENGVGTSATIAFATFKIDSFQRVYYSCVVDICQKNSPACKTACPRYGRKRRDADSQANLLAIGPLIILSDDEREHLEADGTLQMGAGELVDVDIGKVAEVDEDIMSHNLPIILVSATNILIFVLIALVALLVYIRHFSRK